MCRGDGELQKVELEQGVLERGLVGKWLGRLEQWPSSIAGRGEKKSAFFLLNSDWPMGFKGGFLTRPPI